MVDIFRTILEISAFASIMVIAVMGIKAIVGSSVKLKILNILWAVILIRLILPITIESPLHLDEIRFSKSQEALIDSQPAAADLSFLDNLVTTTTSVPIEQIGLQGSEFDSTKQIAIGSVDVTKPILIQKTVSTLKSYSIFHYLMLAWLMGIACLLGYVANKYIRFNRLIKAYSVKAPKDITALCDRLCIRVGVKQDVKVVFTKLVSTPITFKAIKPLIIMPNSFIGKFSKQKLELIMLHEISHIKRKDIAINMLWMVAKIMHWFNPLVWVAYKSYVDDMELACDEMVTSYLTTKQSYAYSQSLIDVIRFSKKEAKLPMVLSFCEDKAKLKRRVENMLKPKRKLKVVSAVCILIVVVMLVGGFTTACLPSEEVLAKSAVENNSVEPVKEIEVKPTPKPKPEIMLKEMLGVPDNIEKEFLLFEDKLMVDIKSNIEIPDISEVPVFEVNPADFTQETVDGFVDTLFDGKEALEIKETPMDKNDIRMQIDTVKRMIDDGVEGYGEEYKAENEKWLEELDDLYATAPEKEAISYVNSDGKLKLKMEKWIPRDDKDTIWGNYTLNVRSHVDYEKSQSLSVNNLVNKVSVDLSKSLTSYKDSYLVYNDMTQGNSHDESGNGYIKAYDGMELEDDKLAETLTYRPSEAVSYVEDFFARAGRNDIKVHSVFIKDNEQKGNVDDIVAGASEYYYEIFMQRVVNEVPYTKGFYGINIDRKTTWSNERISVKVNQSGIFDIKWFSPIEIGKTVMEDAPLIEYKEIEPKIEQYIEENYKGFEDWNEIKNPSIFIDQVALEYLRLPTKDSGGKEAVAIPVWNFYGTAVFHQYVMDHPQEPEVILTINAIDGSLITRRTTY